MNNNGIPAGSIEVTVRGQLPGAADYLRRRLHEALAHAPVPVLVVHATATRHNDPAVADKISVSANIDLNGKAIHVDVDAATVAEAVDHLHDTVRRVLDKAFRPRTARRDVARHEERVAVRDREIVRHHTFSRAAVPVADAINELEALDYRFHLFTEAGTSQDCLLYRTPAGYRLAQLGAKPVAAPGISLSPQHAPRLNLGEAQERLELDGRPFLFFADRETGRGAVLYHRLDGHFGLVTAG